MQVIHAKLENVGAQLVVEGKDSYDTIWPTSRPISTESLIIGALERHSVTIVTMLLVTTLVHGAAVITSFCLAR